MLINQTFAAFLVVDIRTLKQVKVKSLMAPFTTCSMEHATVNRRAWLTVDVYLGSHCYCLR